MLGAVHRALNNGDLTLARVRSIGSAKLLFQGCDLSPNANHLKVEFENAQGAAAWYQASATSSSVVIEESQIEPDLYTTVSWDKNAEGGLFRTRRCTAGGPVTTSTPAVPTRP